MKTTIIYDKSGHIWNVTYGDSILPQGLNSFQTDLPDNTQLTGVEIAADGTVTPKYESMPLSDWQAIQKAIDDAKESTIAEINEQINPKIDYENCSLEDLKSYKIAESKTDLASYLECHPLVSTCHGNKKGTYTITEEKRNMFTSKFTAHMFLEMKQIEDVMTWNESGQACEVWTDEECLQLIKEWNAISTALVKKQQDLELEIKACKTKEDVKKIEIVYSDADPRGVTDTSL